MNAALEVASPGLGVSIQDGGRPGYRALGVPLSGALDPCFLAAANALVGNPAGTAALEVLLAGPRLAAVHGPLRLGLAGDIAASRVSPCGTRQALPAWSAFTLAPGEALQIGRPRGVGYVAVAGGLLTPPLLGSRSTYLRAGIGRALAAGELLPTGDNDPPGLVRAAAPFVHEGGALRVIAGPQADHFSAESLHDFHALPFGVTAERDRMGLRLAGPRLAHRPGGADIVSDGVTPGAIQVPADGCAILLLADCQTVGGYPKIATVIQADLARVAHLQPGEELRFRAVSLIEAAAARQALSARLAAWCAALPPWRTAGHADTATLLAANLAGSAIRGDEP